MNKQKNQLKKIIKLKKKYTELDDYDTSKSNNKLKKIKMKLNIKWIVKIIKTKRKKVS